MPAGSRVEDVCCFNLDGGARGDDGLLTASRPGQVVDCALLYDEPAGTRALSRRDRLRLISEPTGCSVDVLVAAGAHLHKAEQPGS